MLISFLRIDPEVPLLEVNNTPLEKVQTNKVLGVTFCDNLKWNGNTQEIISKAFKRLYLIRILKRAGVPPPHLVIIYNALVRSVLEYACPVWSNSLQQYLNQKIEMVQKRAMRIIYPYTSYDMALSLSSIPCLEERKLSICSRTFTNACDPTSRLFSNVPLHRNKVHGHNLRHTDHVSLPLCRTTTTTTTILFCQIKYKKLHCKLN